MKKMKENIRNGLYFIVKNNFISVFVAAIVVVVYLQINKGETEWFDITFFSSLVCAMVLEVIAQWLSNILMNSLEDSVKLTTDYDALVKKYKKKMFCYNNKEAEKKNLDKLKKIYKKKFEENQDDKKEKRDKEEFDFPIECVCYFVDNKIEIQDKQEQYKLPEIIKEHYDEIIKAHKTSVIYNQLNVRVDNWYLAKNKLVMNTSRTTYFDSMVTNRAMDYRWNNGLSVREALNYGPVFPELETSGLSNHLGFNGFVESKDGHIMFVKRDKNLSIGKGTYANSIGASLKTKYALENGHFTKEGLRNAMISEIYDELKIKEEELEDFTLDKNLIAAYRDMVEGGKPQLLFYACSTQTKIEIENNFKERRKKSAKTFQLAEDGDKFMWIKREKIKGICITSEMMIYNGKVYRMVPSASASVAMLRHYFDEKGMWSCR